MAKEHGLSRRRLFGVAGAAGLGILATRLPEAQASEYGRLDKAIIEMREAKKYLENAPPIFGGHKKEAIKLLKEGIEELEKAIKFAEKHK
jgi:hypothetical protein